MASVWAFDGVHFDFVSAYHGAFAALGALRRAEATGTGTYIDLSQVEAGMAPMVPLYLDALVNGMPWSCDANEVPGAVLSAVVRCAGHDAWAAVELEDLDDLRVLAEVLERPELVAETRDDAAAKVAQVRGHLEAWASQLTPMQVTVKLQHAGLAAAPVQDTEDLWRDPQLRTRGAFVEVDHPEVGLLEQPQSPDRLSRTPGRVRGRSRRLGEDSVEVLEDWLGLDADALDRLRADGAVFQA